MAINFNSAQSHGTLDFHCTELIGASKSLGYAPRWIRKLKTILTAEEHNAKQMCIFLQIMSLYFYFSHWYPHWTVGSFVRDYVSASSTCRNFCRSNCDHFIAHRWLLRKHRWFTRIHLLGRFMRKSNTKIEIEYSCIEIPL